MSHQRKINEKSTTIDNLKILWDYLARYDDLKSSDVIIGFGSNDTSVAERAAELYKAGIAPLIIFTGGLGKGTDGKWQITEAETFREIAINLGVPADRILVENKSTNTGENIQFTRKLLRDHHVHIRLATLVHRPYMGRRIFAAVRQQWPELNVQVTAKQCSLESYIKRLLGAGFDEYEIYSDIVGDFQRIDVFARNGLQIPQPIPNEAIDAYNKLCAMGYTKYVISP